MKRKTFLKLGAAVAVVALAVVTLVSNRTSEPMSDLMMQNIEILTQTEEEGNPDNYKDCLSAGGNWNMASVCTDSGFQTVTCTISGELSFLGFTIKGAYSKGSKYPISRARYTCQPSTDNCCVKQGLYSGDQKLA